MDAARLLAMFAAAPVARWTGARLDFAPDGTAAVTLPWRDDFLQTGGIAHGAAITFAADTSAWFTAAAALDTPVVTAQFSLNLLRPVLPGTGLRATSSIVKRGRTLVVVRARVASDRGEAVAEGLWTHAVLRE